MKHVKSRASQGVDYLQNTRPAMMGGSVARLHQTVNLATVFIALQLSGSLIAGIASDALVLSNVYRTDQ